MIGLRRFVATSTAHRIALKDALKKFYLLVHPDRLTHRPQERRLNERSFAVLQQYLDDFQVQSADSPAMPASSTDPRNVDLTFFVRRVVADDESLKRIDVALQTPARSSGMRPDVGHLERTCRQLFQAADLDLDFFVDDSFDCDRSRAATVSSGGHSHRRHAQYEAATSTRDRFDKHSTSIGTAAGRLGSLARHLQALRERAEREADVVHAAFLHSQSMRVAFEIANSDDGVPPPARRLELLLRLQSTIQKLSSERASGFDGITLVIASIARNTVDGWGRVVLSASGSVEEWTDALCSVDLKLVEETKLAAARIAGLEDQLARSFAMALVYSDFSATPAEMSGVYVRILDEMERMKLVPLVLDVKEALGLELSSATTAFELVPHLGVFKCPSTARVSQIRDFIVRNAARLAREFGEHVSAVRQQEQAVVEVRRMFGLKRLSFDKSNVTLGQMRQCLRRLRERNSDFEKSLSLMAYLPNVSVRIVNTDSYSVSPDGWLCIPWDWRVVDDDDD